MSHCYYHALSSVRRWGGTAKDYRALHDWFDQSKAIIADPRHRALRHHAEGIFQLEALFGQTITNNDGRIVPVRLIGEQHVIEDLGCIPSFADWARLIQPASWFCQTLEGVRAALECMRDHAAEIYRVETGRPFSTVKGSRVSTKLSASMIDARDYLAGRARTRREQYAPEGPVVAFSGGSEWHDHDLLWNRLDQIAARIPSMVLATTAQMKGCDAIATAWAASRGVKVIQFKLDRSQGNRAAFVRNDRIVGLKPVEAIICEGSGIQSNFAQKLRAAGVPLHIFRRTDQSATKAA